MYLHHLSLIALTIWHLTRDADLGWISGSICLDYPLLLFPFIATAAGTAIATATAATTVWWVWWYWPRLRMHSLVCIRPDAE